MLRDVHHQHPKVLGLKVRTFRGVALQAVSLVTLKRVATFTRSKLVLQGLLTGLDKLGICVLRTQVRYFCLRLRPVALRSLHLPCRGQCAVVLQDRNEALGKAILIDRLKV